MAAEEVKTILSEEMPVSQLRNRIRAKEDEIRGARDVAMDLRSLGDALRYQRMRDMSALKEAGLDRSFPRLFSRAEDYYTSPQFSVLCDGLYRSSFEAEQDAQSRETELEKLRKDLHMANRRNRGSAF